ncbi:MAG TPA: PilZ domain-containing protein [Syntrophorhabdaceae bacterium]
MTKTITICFRTSDHLREALKKISREEKRTLSSTIENILYTYIEGKKDFKRVEGEKRRYPRKSVSVPALLSFNKETSAGIILDISLGGLQVLIPADYQFEMKVDEENAGISIVFTLPEIKKPLDVRCAPEHIVRSSGETIMGMSFVDANFDSYRTIQNYLIN